MDSESVELLSASSSLDYIDINLPSEDAAEQISHLKRDAIGLAAELMNVADEFRTVVAAVIDQLILDRRNVSIARLTGAGTSLGVGVPLMIAGIATAPFTFGVSLILTGVGGGVSIAGGLTAGGAQLTEVQRTRKAVAGLPELQRRYNALATRFWESCCNIWNLSVIQLQACLTEGADARRLSSDAAGVTLAKLATAGGRVAMTLAEEGLFAAGRVGATSTASVAGRIVLNGVFVAAAAAIDVYTIVDAALDTFRDGNRSDTVRRLQEEMNRLEYAMVIVEATSSKFTMNLQAGGSDPVLDAMRCAICLEIFAPPPVRCPFCRATVACRACLEPWLREHGTCVACRQVWPGAGTGGAGPGASRIAPDHLVLGLDDMLLEFARRDRDSTSELPHEPPRGSDPAET